MRILFAGTPEFAATALNALIQQGHEIVLVLTQPDRPAGRGRKLIASEVKMVAEAANIPLQQPATLKDAATKAALLAIQFDVAVIAAYGLIIPEWLLQHPKYGCLNIHASLLPRWRGAAPIQRAIAAGDKETGISIMQMDKGLDTGAVLSRAALPITDDDTGGSLHDKLAQLGASTLLKVLQQLPLEGTPQEDSQSCYANKLSKSEAALDWQLTASQLHNTIRAFNPWPVATTTLKTETLRLWQSQRVTSKSAATPGEIIAVSKHGVDVQCGEGCLRITRIQLAGKKPMAVADLINGNPDLFQPGQRFQ